ncbi:Hypothetical protein PEIBARAKI_5856 [Petrimonas sp. IBARAKI]|jgi:hypothetical protein|nr:Hypothetical protein PEIBARAKI_5856 [Petrimonas sp. IBARAKI]
MSKKQLFFLIISVAFIACTGSKHRDPLQVVENPIPVIDLEKAVQSPTEPMKMSDFIESIEYIRPEYPASLVGTIFGVSINDKYLLLEVPDRLLCYTRQGKFLREIGKKGQGPTEHLGIRSSTLLDTVVAINSNFNRKILRYDVQGNYLSSLPVSDEVFKINMSDTNRFVINLHHGIAMDDPNLFVTGILNDKGDTVQLKKLQPYYPKGMAHSPTIWWYGDTVCVHTCVTDTVYSVSKNTITPRYILHQGKYKINREAFKDIRLLEAERSNFIDGLSCCETDGYLLASFSLDKKRWLVYYDKHSHETKSWTQYPDEVSKYGTLVGGGWENDVDGGYKLSQLNAINPDYIAVSILPAKLKEVYTENKKKGIKVKCPKRQQELEKLVNLLNEDENPVIILYKLKAKI